jgi:Na+-translocating ferredoxin:NAD+ oxidoreductase RnfE subunit
MQIIILSALMVFLPLIITGCVVMWREHRDKKLAEQ